MQDMANVRCQRVRADGPAEAVEAAILLAQLPDHGLPGQDRQQAPL